MKPRPLSYCMNKDKFLDIDKVCWYCDYKWILVYVLGTIADFIDTCPNCGAIYDKDKRRIT